MKKENDEKTIGEILYDMGFSDDEIEWWIKELTNCGAFDDGIRLNEDDMHEFVKDFEKKTAPVYIMERMKK